MDARIDVAAMRCTNCLFFLENHQLIFGFSRNVAKFQNLFTQPNKPTLKDATDRILGTFYRVCF